MSLSDYMTREEWEAEQEALALQHEEDLRAEWDGVHEQIAAEFAADANVMPQFEILPIRASDGRWMWGVRPISDSYLVG